MIINLQSFSQVNPPYTCAVRKFTGGVSLSGLRVTLSDVAKRLEMGQGVSLVIVAAALTSASASP